MGQEIDPVTDVGRDVSLARREEDREKEFCYNSTVKYMRGREKGHPRWF
jgi:hypothetical protein